MAVYTSSGSGNSFTPFNAKDLESFEAVNGPTYVDRMNIVNFNDNRSSSLRKPNRLGFYSLKIDKLTGTRIYSPDRSQLRYLSLAGRPNYDLNIGYNSSIRWGEEQVGLGEFLQWILDNRNQFNLPDQPPSIRNLNTDFICFRGVLAKIMLTPYERNEDWMLIAVKINRTIYFHQLKTDAKLAQEENKCDFLNRMSFAGHRFEGYVCKSPDDDIPGGCNDIVKGQQGQFCCVLRSRLNDHSLVYAAEMDCVAKRSQLNDPCRNLKFIEVKTTGTIEKNQQYYNFWRYKAIKWWAQSYLGDVDTILCGYRDKDLHVRKVEEVTTKSLLNSTQYWSDKVCINFLDQFLKFVKSCVTEEMVCYKIYCSPQKDITVHRTKFPVESFIPTWYTNVVRPDVQR